MISTHKQVGNHLYKLEIVTSTMADVITEDVHTKAKLDHRQFTGSRSQTQALAYWMQLTGLVKGGVA